MKNRGARDIFAIIEINGVKFGFTSLADPPYYGEIRDNLKKLIKDEKCQIIVCATRTRGKTCTYVEEYKNDFNNNIEWIKKEIANSEENHASSNQRQAKEILEKINVFSNLIQDNN